MLTQVNHLVTNNTDRQMHLVDSTDKDGNNMMHFVMKYFDSSDVRISRIYNLTAA
jgi:hypothetical protein